MHFAADLRARKEQNQSNVFTPEIMHILPRAGRAGDWDTGHLASWWFSCIGMLCRGFHEKTMTFTETMTFAEISKPWQLSSKLSSESIPFAFSNRVKQLERKEGT